MAAATISNMDAILQNDYQSKTLDALNSQAFIYTKLKKKVLNWTGRQAVYAVKVGRGSGAGYTDGTVPNADHAVWKNLNVTAKILQGRGQIASELMVATDAASAKAFVSAVTSENKNCEEAMIQDANQKFWSGGQVCGFLNEHKVGGAGDDWEFSGDISKLQAALAIGATTVQLIRMDTYAVVSSETVNSVDATNMLVNLSAADTTAVAQGFGVAVKITAPAAFVTTCGLQPLGVYGQFGEPSHLGVDRTTATGDATQLQSNILVANPAGAQTRVDITPPRIQRMINTIEDNSGKKPDLMVGHSSSLEKYAGIFQTAIRVSGSADTKAGAPGYNAGYGSLMYGDLPFESDRMCGKGMIVFFNLDSWRLAERQPIKLWTHAGSAFRPIANSTDVEFIYEGFHNVVCELPRASGALVGLTFA